MSDRKSVRLALEDWCRRADELLADATSAPSYHPDFAAPQHERDEEAA